MEQRKDRAYRLTWETDDLENCDEEYELELEEFPGSDWIPGLIETSPYDLPDPVIFWGNPEFLNDVDYPTSNVNWPIMSRRMYYTLLAVGDFQHRVIPIAMMDGTRFTYEPEHRFLANGQPNPEITNFSDLVIVQLLEKSDYFDFENSDYTRHPRDPDWVDSVEKYALNEPPDGFPPLFRLTVMSSELFISAKARVALLETGIRGTAYHCLDDGYSLQNEVDIPVELPTYF
jgi:hypothetical protein